MGASSSKSVQKDVNASGPPSASTTDGDKKTAEIASLGSVQEEWPMPKSSTGGAEDTTGGGGCPMKRPDGSYSFSFSALSRGFQHPSVGVLGAKAASAEVSQAENESRARQGEEESAEGKCPVRSTTHRVPEYNVYSQPIDSSNQMPGAPNQLPAPQQTKPLSTERVVSNIPKVRLVFCGTHHLYLLLRMKNPVCGLLCACAHG